MNIHGEFVISSILLALVLFIVTIGIAVFIVNLRLGFYVKKNQYDQWKKLTTIGPMGPGMSNPFLWFNYLYSDLKQDDRTIYKFKKKTRILIKYFLGLILITAGMVVLTGLLLS